MIVFQNCLCEMLDLKSIKASSKGPMPPIYISNVFENSSRACAELGVDRLDIASYRITDLNYRFSLSCGHDCAVAPMQQRHNDTMHILCSPSTLGWSMPLVAARMQRYLACRAGH